MEQISNWKFCKENSCKIFQGTTTMCKTEYFDDIEQKIYHGYVSQISNLTILFPKMTNEQRKNYFFHKCAIAKYAEQIGIGIPIFLFFTHIQNQELFGYTITYDYAGSADEFACKLTVENIEHFFNLLAIGHRNMICHGNPLLKYLLLHIEMIDHSQLLFKYHYKFAGFYQPIFLSTEKPNKNRKYKLKDFQILKNDILKHPFISNACKSMTHKLYALVYKKLTKK